MVWHRHETNGYEVYGTRVTGTGQVTDPAGVKISNEPVQGFAPKIASDGDGFFAAWFQLRDGIHGARIGPNGQVLDASNIRISRFWGGMGGVAFNGVDYLVTWHASNGLGGEDILAARVSREGVVLDSSALEVRSQAQALALAARGSDFLVYWRDGQRFDPNIYLSRVGKDGVVGPPKPVASIANRGIQSAVARGSSGALVTWASNEAGSYDIYGALVRNDAPVADKAGILLAKGPISQTSPSIASNGEEYLAVWLERRNPATGSDHL